MKPIESLPSLNDTFLVFENLVLLSEKVFGSCLCLFFPSNYTDFICTSSQYQNEEISPM